MVRLTLDREGASPLAAAYNVIRLLNRELRLSQVTGSMYGRAPRKLPRRKMQEQAQENRQQQRQGQQPDSKPPVCRRLFPDDSTLIAAAERDNVINKTFEEIDRDLDGACEKYNFDFRNEVPLEGDWVWEPIGGPADDIHEASPDIPPPGGEHPAGAPRQDA